MSTVPAACAGKAVGKDAAFEVFAERLADIRLGSVVIALAVELATTVHPYSILTTTRSEPPDSKKPEPVRDRANFRALGRSLAGGKERTLVKLVVDSASQRVLGAHMVGGDAAEIIQSLAIAVRMGATKADFDATVALHPTSAEEFVTLKEKTTRTRPG